MIGELAGSSSEITASASSAGAALAVGHMQQAAVQVTHARVDASIWWWLAGSCIDQQQLGCCQMPVGLDRLCFCSFSDPPISS